MNFPNIYILLIFLIFHKSKPNEIKQSVTKTYKVSDIDKVLPLGFFFPVINTGPLRLFLIGPAKTIENFTNDSNVFEVTPIESNGVWGAIAQSETRNTVANVIGECVAIPFAFLKSVLPVTHEEV